MHPTDEVLAAIALGDKVSQSDIEHVGGCPNCSATVAELTDLKARVAATADVQLTDPPELVWAAIAAEVDDHRHEDLPPATASTSSDAPGQNPAPVSERHWSRRAWLFGAAAAGVAIGVVGSQLVPRLTQSQPTLLAQTTLDTLDTKKPGGEATLTTSAGALELTLSLTPLDPGSGYLEVWLINTDLKRMVSIGVLPGGASQQVFPITASLIEMLSVALGLPFLVVAIESRAIVELLLGPQWDVAAGYLAWLALPMYVLAVTCWIDRLFDVYGRQKYGLWLEGGFFAVITLQSASLFVAGHPGLVVPMFAMTSTVYYLLYARVAIRTSRLVLGDLRRVVAVTAGALIVGGATWSVLPAGWPAYGRLLAYFGAYLALVLAWLAVGGRSRVFDVFGARRASATVGVDE